MFRISWCLLCVYLLAGSVSYLVGSVAGLMGAVGSFGAMLFDLMVGSALTHTHSYSLVLLSAGLLHPIAFLLILFLIPRIEPAATA